MSSSVSSILRVERIDMLHQFIEKEIRNLKLLRLIGIGFLLSVDLLLVSSLGYLVFQNYQERAVAESFWDFAGLPLLSLSAVILLPLLSLIWLIIRRFDRTIRQLKDLNDFYAKLYQDYCRQMPRAFSGIPGYLFTQEGLVFNWNLGQKTLTKDDFDQIEVLNIRRGIRGVVKVSFYQGKNRKVRLYYYWSYHPAVDFLLAHISLIHPSVTINHTKKGA